MKSEEDEAFDDLAKKQGDWGGGFKAKRAMAADKLQEPPSEWAGIKAILDEYGLQAIDFVADFKAAVAGREWNFCERCGKRTKDLTTIHTCTPPQEKNNA